MSIKVPTLRFPSFENGYNLEKLGEITTKVGSGSTPKGGEKVYQNTGVLFIRSQNVNHNRLLLEDVTYISESIHAKMAGSTVRAKDILLNITGASIGRSCVVPEDFTTGNVNQHVAIVRINEEHSPEYIQSYISSDKGQKQIFEGQARGAREGLNFQNIRNIKIYLPSIKEQYKVASFLTTVDEKIQLLKKQQTHLELYKKGVMQKIFSRELRFKDENGKDFPEWKESTIKEVLEKQSSNISANSIEFNFGDYIIYGAAGILKKVDFYEIESDYISIVKDGAGVGRLLYCEGKSSVLGTLDILSPILSIVDPRFIYYLLSTIDFTKYVTGSTIPHIYFRDYQKEKVRIPEKKEQQKIASFLIAIDEKIDNCKEQIRLTEEWKKGLLQQMFV